MPTLTKPTYTINGQARKPESERAMRSINTWMERHLQVRTFENDKPLNESGIQDPFATTVFRYLPSRWSLFLQLIGVRSRLTTFRVQISGDNLATRRWFTGESTCEKCDQNRIGHRLHPQDHDAGYHHGDMRICEDCYYEVPTPLQPRSEVDACLA